MERAHKIDDPLAVESKRGFRNQLESHVEQMINQLQPARNAIRILKWEAEKRISARCLAL
jgi:hypothetical protein